MTLGPGEHFFHQEFGHLRHEEIIGRPPGLRFTNGEGKQVVCYRPTLEDYLMRRLKRRTQILYPKDLGLILVWGDIFPGARVLEAGLGSAAATLFLLRHLGPGGHLISYERRQEFVEAARATLDEVEDLYGKLPARHTVITADIYEGIAESGLDTILLDVPEPERAAGHAAATLRIGGVMLCWLPTALQVYQLVRLLQEDLRWAQIEISESLLRPWTVGPRSVRPVHRMVAHTGFLIRARRVEPLPLSSYL